MPREDIDEPDDVKKKDSDDAMTSEGDVSDAICFLHGLKFSFMSFAEYGQLPFYRRAVNWVCGIDQQLQEQPEFSEEELAAMAAAQTNIDEKPYWRRFTLAQAIILMFVASFICGFFAYSEYIVPIDYPR